MCDRKAQACCRLTGDEREHIVRGKEHININISERVSKVMRSKRINHKSTYFNFLVAINVGDSIKNLKGRKNKS